MTGKLAPSRELDARVEEAMRRAGCCAGLEWHSTVTGAPLESEGGERSALPSYSTAPSLVLAMMQRLGQMADAIVELRFYPWEGNLEQWECHVDRVNGKGEPICTGGYGEHGANLAVCAAILAVAEGEERRVE